MKSKCPVQVFYEELLATVGERSRKGLELIHALCKEERERPNPVLTVAHIGRLSSKRNGPTVATLRNRAQDYAALIHRHAAAVRQARAKPTDQDWLSQFGDPEQRSFVGSLLAENKGLRAQLRALKQLADRRTAIVLDAPAKTPASAPVSASTLTRDERTILGEALNPERMAHFGWTEDALGRVVNTTGLSVFPVGFLAALRKAAAESVSEG